MGRRDDVDGGIRMIDGSYADSPFPIRRPKRDPKDYRGPRPSPGQTVMLCPTEHKMMLFNFRPFQMLECDVCGFRISRKDATT